MPLWRKRVRAAQQSILSWCCIGLRFPWPGSGRPKDEQLDGPAEVEQGFQCLNCRPLEAVVDIVEQSDHDARLVHVERSPTQSAAASAGSEYNYELTERQRPTLLVGCAGEGSRARGIAMSGAEKDVRCLAALVRRTRDACRSGAADQAPLRAGQRKSMFWLH